jgi:hypothetical protein
MRSLARVIFGPGRSAWTMFDSIENGEALSALNCREHQLGPVEELPDFAKMRDGPPSAICD